jgi:hypothetical protein
LAVYAEEDARYFAERDDVVVVYPREPVDGDSYLKEQLVDVAEVLGIDPDQNKEDLVEEINAVREQRVEE